MGKKFDFLEELGKGAMCKVYKATSKSKPEQVYAVRIIDITAPEML